MTTEEELEKPWETPEEEVDPVQSEEPTECSEQEVQATELAELATSVALQAVKQQEEIEEEVLEEAEEAEEEVEKDEKHEGEHMEEEKDDQAEGEAVEKERLIEEAADALASEVIAGIETEEEAVHAELGEVLEETVAEDSDGKDVDAAVDACISPEEVKPESQPASMPSEGDRGSTTSLQGSGEVPAKSSVRKGRGRARTSQKPKETSQELPRRIWRSAGVGLPEAVQAKPGSRARKPRSQSLEKIQEPSWTPSVQPAAKPAAASRRSSSQRPKPPDEVRVWRRGEQLQPAMKEPQARTPEVRRFFGNTRGRVSVSVERLPDLEWTPRFDSKVERSRGKGSAEAGGKGSKGGKGGKGRASSSQTRSPRPAG